MATGNIRGGKRNYAEPSSLVISTVASTTANSATVTITKGSFGPQALTYTISATSPTTNAVIPSAQTITADSTGAASTTFTVASSSQSYVFTAYGTNYNGAGSADVISSNAITAAAVYTASTSYASPTTTTVTVPTFATKMAALVVGGGGSGAGASQYNGGNGGQGGGGTIFKDYTVTGGSTFQVVVGGASGTSSITVSNTVIAQANANNGTSNVAGATNFTYGVSNSLTPYSLTNTNITQGHSGAGRKGGDYGQGYSPQNGAAFGYGGDGQGFEPDFGYPYGGVGSGGSGGVALYFK
jgi:hypothetical protein